MANTLTNLFPDLYSALNVVSREAIGFMPSVGRNSGAERAAVGENVRVPIANSRTAGDVTPSMTIPDPEDTTATNENITITKSRQVSFGLLGEEQKGLSNGSYTGGVDGTLSLQAQLMAEGMRTLFNEMEADLATLYVDASRATGTAGTTPFASGVGDTAQARKILIDNGGPQDMQMTFDSAAGALLRTNTQLTKANEAATPLTLRQGELLDINGFSLRESGQVNSHTKGTGTAYTSDTAGYAVGATSITLITGSGTIIAGDVATFAGDTNKYIVKTGIAAPGTIVLAAPGLRVAIPASAVALTVGADFVANMFYRRGAIQLVTRAPEIPQEGDSAVESELITDPFTGMTIEARTYIAYRKVRHELAMAWGFKTIKPEHVGILLG